MYDWIGKMTRSKKALRRVSIVTGWLPRSVLYSLCLSLGWMLYRFSGSKLRNHIKANMQDLLSPLSQKELRLYCRDYFCNLTITLYEILVDSYRLEQAAGAQAWRFKSDGEHHLQEALEMGKGAIIYTPHLGNFFYSYWYLTRKYPCLTIATAGSEELRPLYLKFQDMGCAGLDYDATPPLELLRKLRKHLAGGGVLFILGDFWRPTFPVSRFFGRTTRTPEGAANLALEAKCPVIPFYGFRGKGFTHQLVFEAPLYLHEKFKRTEQSEATDELNSFMEKAIRAIPAQWFYWFNAEERWETSTPQSMKSRNMDAQVAEEEAIG